MAGPDIDAGDGAVASSNSSARTQPADNVGTVSGQPTLFFNVHKFLGSCDESFGDTVTRIRSLPDTLPGEVLVRIVREALRGLGEVTCSREWRQGISDLAGLNTRFREAMCAYLATEFRMIPSAASQPITVSKAATAPWLPKSRSDADAPATYWAHHLGSTFDESPALQFQHTWLRRVSTIALKILTIDTRIVQYDRACDARAWNWMQGPQWFQAGAILAIIAHNVTTLENIHIRLAAHDEHVESLQHIIRNNPKATSIIIEVDSALDVTPGPRPSIDVTKFCNRSISASMLERFILRAPSCEVRMAYDEPFLPRLKNAEEVRLAAYRIQAPGEPTDWAIKLLRKCEGVIAFELAAAQGGYHSIIPSAAHKVVLHNLKDLTLDLPAVDARTLRLVNAPNLTRLRINTRYAINAHGKLDAFHFPSLHWVRIGCTTSVVRRLEAIGVPRASFARSLASVEQEWADHEGDFSAYIREDIRVRRPLRSTSEDSDSTDGSSASIYLTGIGHPHHLVLLSPGSLPAVSPGALALGDEYSDLEDADNAEDADDDIPLAKIAKLPNNFTSIDVFGVSSVFEDGGIPTTGSFSRKSGRGPATSASDEAGPSSRRIEDTPSSPRERDPQSSPSPEPKRRRFA